MIYISVSNARTIIMSSHTSQGAREIPRANWALRYEDPAPNWAKLGASCLCKRHSSEFLLDEYKEMDYARVVETQEPELSTFFFFFW